MWTCSGCQATSNKLGYGCPDGKGGRCCLQCWRDKQKAENQCSTHGGRATQIFDDGNVGLICLTCHNEKGRGNACSRCRANHPGKSGRGMRMPWVQNGYGGKLCGDCRSKIKCKVCGARHAQKKGFVMRMMQKMDCYVTPVTDASGMARNRNETSNILSTIT